MTPKERLRAVIDDTVLDLDKFTAFFRSVKGGQTISFPKESLYFDNEQFSQGLKIGEAKLEDGNFIICSFSVNRDLTERSGKKAQYEIAKNVLKQEQSDAGIFIFYDSSGSFRFSLIYTNYLGRKRDWSTFRRFTYFVSKEQTNKTFLNQIGEADFSSLSKIKEAFSVEKVTEEFFQAYRYAITDVIIKSFEDSHIPYEKKHSFSQLLLSRILFIYFLQKKGWLKWKNYESDTSYISNLWHKYKSLSKSSDSFYSIWLKSLFFGAFNKKSHLIDKSLPDEIRESFIQMPFLNGGLFSQTELDELGFQVTDKVFEWLLEPDFSEREKRKGFLEIFNFTIDEASPVDVEVAVDPEMLGMVYESLIADEERGGGGIFYTPRVEIDFMCRLSLMEYLHSQLSSAKDSLIDIVFNPDSIAQYIDIKNLKEIKSHLSKVKVVDPAVGSASFLVGMLNILVELHSALTKKIEGKEENLFALKHRIILENLFGIDVKDWAVMVGELRLWLSLIIETDEKYMDIYTKPLLPNLSFKVRQGDSLVEEIGGVLMNLRSDALRLIPNDIKSKIQHLVDKKYAFFSGQRSADLKGAQEIKQFEMDIFKEILESKISELDKKITGLDLELTNLTAQGSLFEGKKKDYTLKIKNIQQNVKELQYEHKRFKDVLSFFDNSVKKDYFLWELDFAEVFALNGGFDIVIGNPPYVRQELIAPPLVRQDKYEPDEWRNIKGQYKDKLINSAKNIWGGIKKIDKKSDLCVYFYYQGLSLLNDNGIFCFINSNSWLDVGYGAGLQEFLLKSMKPVYIIDNIAKRSFKQADVNTVIVLIQKPKEKIEDFTLKFVAFKKPFEEAINADVLREIEKTNKPVFDNEIYRLYPKTKKELLEEGVEYPDEEEKLKFEITPEQLPYIGNKWGGKYLRAPEIYFKILEKGKDKLVRLGDIAEVRRGFTTGANEFFYLKPVGRTVKEVVEIAEKNPNALIEVENGAGWRGEIEAEFLKPVIKSPRELKTIMVRIEDLNYLVLMCHKDKKELKATKVLEYIEWGEKQKFNQRPTCKSRPKWWDLGGRKSFIKVPMFYGERLFFVYTESLCDAQLYDVIICKDFYNPIDLCVSLNTTLTLFFIENSGRNYGGGGGPSKLQVYEAKNLHFIPINNFSLTINVRKQKVKSIFTELGFDPDNPIREQEPNPLPDRKALDDIVFDALGLTEEERKEVYWAVAELVKARLDKAKSV